MVDKVLLDVMCEELNEFVAPFKKINTSSRKYNLF